MPRRNGSKRKKTRTHVKPADAANDPTAAKVPKSIVIKSGTVGSSVASLVRDVRKVLEPNTGTKLRERKANRLRDFVSMSGPLGVTHMLVFSQPPSTTTFPLTPSLPLPPSSASTATSPSTSKKHKLKSSKEEAEERAEKSLLEGTTTLNMRLIRLPRGPTLGFKVLRYSLASDVLRMARRPRSIGREFAEGPLLILSGFGGEDKQLKLMTTIFQNLFPPIHVQTMPLASARRVVLLSYNPQTHTVDFRHYLISVRPVGVSKAMRKIVGGSTANKALPINRKRERSASVGASSDEEGTGNGGGIGARGKGILDLGRAEDISDYVLRHEGMGFVTSDSEQSDQSDGGSQSGHSSGSEEDERRGKVRLAGDYVGRGNRGSGVKGEKRAVRLVELGPRMELGLIKIEEGVGEGEVMFHEMVHKSVKEAAALAKVHSAKRKLATERRTAQALNVAAKKAAKKAAKGESADVEGEEDDDEEEEGEEDEDKIDSDNSFDYDEAHGLGVGSEEELSEGSSGAEVDEGEDEANQSDADDSDSQADLDEDVEMDDSAFLATAQVQQFDDEDDSDLSPVAYNSNSSPEPESIATFKPKKSSNRPAGNGPMSFKHKSFVKQERAAPKKAMGIHTVAPPKKKPEGEDTGDRFGTDSRGRGRGGRGGDRGRGERGGRGGGERGRSGSRGGRGGERGGFSKRGESSRGGASRGGRGGSRGGTGGRGRD